MSDQSARQSLDLRLPRGGWGWAAVLALAYVVVFMVTAGDSPALAAGTAAANVGAVLPVAVLLAWAHRRGFFDGSPVRRAGAHVLGAAVFSAGWYGCVVVLLGLVFWRPGHSLNFTPFSGPALPWQLFQGLTVYAALAAWRFGAPPPPADAEVTPGAGADRPQDAPGERLLVRRGDEIVPIDLADVVCIRGADDETEVVTARSRDRVRLPLHAFERRLPADRFLRAHRSWIVNLDQLTAAEPAGDGRLTLHLSGGQTLTTSREGARALRSRVV